MSADPVISVQNVSKAYRIWDSPSARLTAPFFESASRTLLPKDSPARRWLLDRAQTSYRDFWALRDVSFEIRRGECMGIIGRNGSGKSTLLQIIAGTLQPTRGTVKVNGRVAALLELGSGFNPEFTGRENVMLNGAILGFTSAQMEAKFDEITLFADIGDFIDQPIKIYSSGMMLRLAFAVQTAVEPDVLIIDEALSVGDAPFQAKCFARIRHLQGSGCTILFVSHDIGTIRTFCHHAVWLKDGLPQAQGAALVVCDAYARECARDMGMTFAESTPTNDHPKPPGDNRSKWLREGNREFAKLAVIERHGNGPIRIRNFFFLNERECRTAFLQWDEQVTAVFVLGTDVDYEGFFQLGVVCKTLQGQELMSCSDRAHGQRLRLAAGEEAVITLRFRLPLRGGKYTATTGLYLFPDDARFPIGTYDFTRAIASDYVTHSAVFEIAPQFNLGIYGPVHQEAQLSVPAP